MHRLSFQCQAADRHGKATAEGKSARCPDLTLRKTLCIKMHLLCHAITSKHCTETPCVCQVILLLKWGSISKITVSCMGHLWNHSLHFRLLFSSRASVARPQTRRNSCTFGQNRPHETSSNYRYSSRVWWTKIKRCHCRSTVMWLVRIGSQCLCAVSRP